MLGGLGCDDQGECCCWGRAFARRAWPLLAAMKENWVRVGFLCCCDVLVRFCRGETIPLWKRSCQVAAGSLTSTADVVAEILTLGEHLFFGGILTLGEHFFCLVYDGKDTNLMVAMGSVGITPGSAADPGLDKHAAAALLNHGVDDSHDLVYSSSDLGTDEGLNRHVLAGSLFSGTGEQASGRVDVPGKDIQQQAASAKDFICFFVKSLGGASLVVKTEQRATVAQVKQHVALKSGVCEEAFYLVWEGRVLRDDDTLECLGVVRDSNCI